jgi:hypothetical protein
MASERGWAETGNTEYVGPHDQMEIPDFDPRSGDHLFTVVVMYRVDPTLTADPSHMSVLDHENRLAVVGPGCYYCETPWTPGMEKRRCKGEPRG